MGVVKFTPDMNATNNSTDISVLNRRSGSLTNENTSDCSVFDNKEAEDIDSLKAKMKLKLGGPVGTVVDVSSTKDKEHMSPRFFDSSMNGHELSVSLPNLNEADDISLRTNCKNEKNVRSSLSDIYDGKLSPTSVICSPNSSVNSTSCLLSKSPELRSESLECSPNEKQTLLQQKGQGDGGLHLNSVKSKMGDVMITMDRSGNRLSAVLENIPLFYLPQTKQLISLSPEHKQKASSVESPEGGKQQQQYTTSSRSENSVHKHACSTTNHDDQCSNSNELSAHGTNSDTVLSCSNHVTVIGDVIGATGSAPTTIGATGSAPTTIGATSSAPNVMGATGSAPTTIGATGGVPTAIGATGSVPTAIGATGSAPTANSNHELLATESSNASQSESQQARSRRLSSGADSECSTLALSQDSDASSSCRTVFNSHSHVLTHTQGKSTDSRSLKSSDFDEISLSHVSLERDSPKDTLHRANTIGSLPLGDGSSFSSISSISTGTDFSISAASYTDDFIEIRSGLPDGEEGGFMEINLNTRNSFERSRNSSMDSGIDEKCHQGAKPKRRGLSGFFTRYIHVF